MEHLPGQRRDLEPACDIRLAWILALQACMRSIRLAELPHIMSSKSAVKNRPKHQHWVPQFYLRYYATPETRESKQPQVWILSKDDSDGDEKLTNVRNICGQRYLYSPMLETGDRDWTLDGLLNDLESGLAPIWPTLAKSYVALDDSDLRRGVALFLAVTYLRNPDIRMLMERLHSKIVEACDTAPKLADGTPDIEGVEINGKYHPISTADWHGYRSWGEAKHDEFFAQLVRSDATRIAEHLIRKRWSIVFADEDTFITTDKPVGLQHETRKKFGIETQETIITFPVSPTRILILDDMHSEPGNQYYPLNKGSGPAFNVTLWQSARRFLITGRPVPEVLEEMLLLNGNEEYF